MKTGQSTTSFHPATGNPIMTSTTYNRSAAYATDESKTGRSKESNGATLDSNRGRGQKAYPLLTRGGQDGRGRKGLGLRLLRLLNDLLPISIRPVKSKRAHRRRYLGIRHRIFTYRMVWRSHWKNALLVKLGLRESNKR
jgi:hypothetical protein